MTAALLPDCTAVASVRQVVVVARSFCKLVVKRCLSTNCIVIPGLL